MHIVGTVRPSRLPWLDEATWQPETKLRHCLLRLQSARILQRRLAPAAATPRRVLRPVSAHRRLPSSLQTSRWWRPLRGISPTAESLTVDGGNEPRRTELSFAGPSRSRRIAAAATTTRRPAMSTQPHRRLQRRRRNSHATAKSTTVPTPPRCRRPTRLIRMPTKCQTLPKTSNSHINCVDKYASRLDTLHFLCQ